MKFIINNELDKFSATKQQFSNSSHKTNLAMNIILKYYLD